ncbi:MAG: hypothetical protein KGQ79_05220 [Proteobacteria bacterium]|nr:hypothetical protein [Pseudomonadota bacterium]MBU6425521.1 hypothetical protein [Rhodospirillales bacterium]
MRPGSLIFWLLCAFGTSLGIGALVLAAAGAGVAGTRLALDMTARFSFLLFWLAYTGGALHDLFGPVFLPLKRHARTLGLAFASAQSAHFMLVAWLCYLGAAPSLSTFLFFGTALIWLYLIALLSFSTIQRHCPPRLRQLIFFMGLNYIAYAFAVDFFVSPLQGGLKHVLFYLPFALAALAGPSLRLAAFLRRAKRSMLLSRTA